MNEQQDELKTFLFHPVLRKWCFWKCKQQMQAILGLTVWRRVVIRQAHLIFAHFWEFKNFCSTGHFPPLTKEVVLPHHTRTLAEWIVWMTLQSINYFYDSS